MTFLSSMKKKKKNNFVFDWNNTQSYYDKSKIIPQIFEENLSQFTQSTACIKYNESLNYLALNQTANQLANYLRDKGIKQNSLVVISMRPSMNMLIGILAVLKAGGAYVPIDLNYPADRIGMILEDTAARCILTETENENIFKDYSIQKIYLDEMNHQIQSYSADNLKYINDPSNLAYVIYTSGSTGKPKGVMISHQNMNNFVHWFSRALPLQTNLIFDFSSSLAFDFTVSTTLFPMLMGHPVIICDESTKKDPFLFYQHLKKYQINSVKLTPSYFRIFKEIVLEENAIIPLDNIILGGELLLVKDLTDWLERYPEQVFFCEYGPTEATIATSWIKINKNNIHDFKHSIPLGKPALNTTLYVLNSELEHQEIGEPGELYIGGDGVALGYLNRKDLTDKKFIKDIYQNTTKSKLYKTGDICCYLQDGNIEFLKRADQQIKINGYRVELEEIEYYLNCHPDVQQAVVCIQTKENNSSKLIAYCMPRNNNFNKKSLHQYLLEHLPTHMIPAIQSISKIPLNTNGKVDKTQLQHLITDQPILQDDKDPHGKLKAIWSSILDTEALNEADNFFELGGNSLTAAKILIAIKKEYNKHVSLKTFYENPTIQSLSEAIQLLPDIHKNDEITVIKKHSKIIPLSDFQLLFWFLDTFYKKTKIPNIIVRKKISGKLDLHLFNQSIIKLCQFHPTLQYHIHKFIPYQNKQHIDENLLHFTDLSNISAKDRDCCIQSSLEHFANYKWSKGVYPFCVKLIKIAENLWELHIVISHLICDEISANIMLEDLSKIYISLQQNRAIFTDVSHADQPQFIEYIYQEKAFHNRHLNESVHFWEHYLQDITPVHMPDDWQYHHKVATENEIFDLPEKHVVSLRKYSQKNRLNISAILSAMVSEVCVVNINKHHPLNHFIFGFVKSKRDDIQNQNLSGLFLQSDLIKLDVSQLLDKSSTEPFLNFVKKTQNALIEAQDYQNCPFVVKIASYLKKFWKHKKIRNYLITKICFLYCKVFKKAELNPAVLSMFGKIFLARQNYPFFLTINIMNRFISLEETHREKLFKLPVIQSESYFTNEGVTKNAMNIWFGREENNKFFFGIAAKIKPEIRQSIGKQILAKFENLTVE